MIIFLLKEKLVFWHYALATDLFIYLFILFINYDLGEGYCISIPC